MTPDTSYFISDDLEVLLAKPSQLRDDFCKNLVWLGTVCKSFSDVADDSDSEEARRKSSGREAEVNTSKRLGGRGV
jgi:hypothetical protein